MRGMRVESGWREGGKHTVHSCWRGGGCCRCFFGVWVPGYRACGEERKVAFGGREEVTRWPEVVARGSGASILLRHVFGMQ